MAQKIAFFNHKGGVSKTTTTFQLGWMLASKGKRVILVDADPQCNLTGLVLGLEQFEELAQREPERNLKGGIAPAFEARPVSIKAVDCIEVENQQNLFLLPGSLQLSEYDVTLGIAQELSGTIQTLKNLPGSILFLLDVTAEKYQADYMLIDMNPSLSSLNQNLLMISDFFIIPTSPDYFSVMAIRSLSIILPRWYAWARTAAALPILQNADYPFHAPQLKLLGTVIQNFRPKSGAATKGFQTWIDEINKIVSTILAPALSKDDMMLPDNAYQQQHLEPGYCLATIADFNNLIAYSQQHHKPIYELTSSEIDKTGVVLEKTINSRDKFKMSFSAFADKIIGLTENARSLQPV